ncbi:MAG: Gfo/Idh/MocA family oxidoreductase [Cyclobacteriaceae bacterium]|nr:Gfo/Idh/MocA family oxidoreductase [Cyclobacteriaceae bacterium]
MRFGIIGTGAIAGHHAACINELEGCELVGVSSTSGERARQAEEKFGVRGYANYQLMMEEARPDIVCICTKSGSHLEPTQAAAALGIHVLSEKPLEVSLERADLMISVCRESGVQLGCIFQNRFSPDYVQLKHAVDQGKLGKLLMGNAYIKWFRNDDYYKGSNWRGTLQGDGGAALINQGIHTIDLLLNVMGCVQDVFGQVRTMTHDIEGEDVGMAMLNFENGAMGTIQGSTSFWPGYPERLEIFGEKGSVILEAGKITAWNVQGMDSPVKPEQQDQGSGASDPMAISHQLHLAQFRDFVSAVAAGRTPTVNGEEGRKALALILAVYESSRRKEVLPVK